MTDQGAKDLALNRNALQRLQELEQILANVTRIQCSDGTWNYDPYMFGMANGLIFALAVLRGEEPVYLSPPLRWSRDNPPLAALANPVVTTDDRRTGQDNRRE